MFSRQNELQLLIALGKKKNHFVKKIVHKLLDTNLKATGELYWDDGESLVPNDDFSQHNYYHFLYNFTVNQQSASLTITRDRAAVFFKYVFW